MVHWFAERVDRVILLFDAHKLDISDEFRRTIQTLNSYEDKVRIVLNKSDRVSPQQLMRVYGALMWSLGNLSYVIDENTLQLLLALERTCKHVNIMITNGYVILSMHALFSCQGTLLEDS